VKATNASGNTTAGAPIVPLVDNFTSDSGIDSNVWAQLNQQGDTSNGEIQCYEPGQNALDPTNGLEETIQHQGSTFTCPAGTPSSTNPLSYLSGAVQEIGTSFTFGTITFSAKFAGGTGTWPAVWMSGATCQTSATAPNTFLSGTSGTLTGFFCPWPSDASDSAEIDIAEVKNATSANNVVAENLITSGGTQSCQPTISGDETGFHTYELDWTSGAVTWKVDGTQQCQFTSNVPTHPMFVIINTALCSSGSSCAGSPNNGTLPQTTSVAWIHVSH
jgi:beta-glucanase (GH16 family)